MSACTGGTSSNPHEAIGADQVGVSSDLKNAAIEAHQLNRDILAQIAPSNFTGVYNFLPSDSSRLSAETPAMKDGSSYWNFQTSSILKKDTDVGALFIELRTYLESRGFTLTADDHKPGSPGWIVGGADFKSNGTIRYIRLNVNGGPDYKDVAINVITANYPNPPMSEWPDLRGDDWEWNTTEPLWPEGLGPTPTPSASPSGQGTP